MEDIKKIIAINQVKEMEGISVDQRDRIIKIILEDTDTKIEKPVSNFVVVTRSLHDLGIPAHIKGYQYLREAIMFVIKDNTLITNITKVLYPMIAQNFNTTSSRVERAIRHAIKLAWERGDCEIRYDYFGFTIDNKRGKPTNSEFIAMVADQLKLKNRL